SRPSDTDSAAHPGRIGRRSRYRGRFRPASIEHPSTVRMNSHLGRTTRILMGVVLALVAAGYTASSPEFDQSALERAAAAIGNPLLSVWALLPVWLVMC